MHTSWAGRVGRISYSHACAAARERGREGAGRPARGRPARLSERAVEAMSTTDSERAEKSECVRACVLAWHSE